MTFPARGSGSLCLHKDFWDRHRANFTTRQKVVYWDVETTFCHIFPTDKLQCLSRGDPRNICANTRTRILSRERSSCVLPGKTNGFNKSKKYHPKKQRARSDFFASSIFSAWNFFSPACLIDFPHSDPFAHFMKTPISQCFGIRDKFTSTVKSNSWCKRKMQIEITDENLRKNLNTLLENSGLSHLSLFGFSKLFGLSRIPHSIKDFVFFFRQTKLW